MTDVLNQSQGLFDTSDQAQRGVLPLQTAPSAPAPATLDSATGLISPDQATLSRLSHFSEDLYDLRPSSHLVRLMRVLLGDSGVGQMRKRYTVARLQTALTSSHFYDLDGFYGALFGARRRVEEQLPINPMASTALPDEWDDISARDAKYRERVSALAKALPMAGTLPGLQQAAEALTGVECDIYEVWPLLDLHDTTVVGRAWSDVETAFTSWDSFETTVQTWDSVRDQATIGQAGITSRDEVYIRPKRNYDPVDSTDDAIRESQRLRQEDEMSLQRVLRVLKPAGVLLTVDSQGIPLHIPAPIAAINADSNFWQVIAKVRPRLGLATTSNPYPTSPVKVAVGQVDASGDLQPLPVPPFSASQGDQWSYNAAISSVNGYAMIERDATVTGTGAVVDKYDWEKVQQVRSIVDYAPGRGVADQRAMAAARAASDSILMAHPYAGPRVVVGTHG